jgi:hypothetical protein
MTSDGLGLPGSHAASRLGQLAEVRVPWRFAEGIWLVDRELIPPFSQIDTYIVVESRGVWFVAAHNMQEKKP